MWKLHHEQTKTIHTKINYPSKPQTTQTHFNRNQEPEMPAAVSIVQ